LLSTPNSLASSYTRTFATALPLLGPAGTGPVSRAGQRVLRPASASAVHRRMLIGRSSQSQPALPGPGCPGPAAHLPALPTSSTRPRPTRRPVGRDRADHCPATLPGRDWPRYSASLPVPSGPGIRSARANERLRCASSKHPWLGCRYAPRPGPRASGSGTISFPAATRRSKSDLATRAPHPTQVRIAGACRTGCGYRVTIFLKLTVPAHLGHRARYPPAAGHR